MWLHIHTDLSEFAAAFLPAVRETRSVQCLSAIFPSIPISFSDLHVSLIHCASKVRDFKPLWLSPLHPTVFHPDRKLLHFFISISLCVRTNSIKSNHRRNVKTTKEAPAEGGSPFLGKSDTECAINIQNSRTERMLRCQARIPSQRCICPSCLNCFLQLYTLRIFVIFIAHAAAAPNSSSSTGKLYPYAVSRGADQPVCCGQFPNGFTSYARYLVLQIRIVETRKDTVDIGLMRYRIHGEFPDKSRAALLHGLIYNGADCRVLNTLKDCPMPAKAAKIGTDGVTAVQCKEFAFNICIQIIDERHTVNLRQFALPARFFNVPLGKFFYSHIQWRLQKTPSAQCGQRLYNRQIRHRHLRTSVFLHLEARKPQSSAGWKPG